MIPVFWMDKHTRALLFHTLVVAAETFSKRRGSEAIEVRERNESIRHDKRRRRTRHEYGKPRIAASAHGDAPEPLGYFWMNTKQ